MNRSHELAASIINRYLSLHRDQRHFSHHMRKEFAVSGRQLIVLRYLCETGPRSVSEISRFLYVRDGTTSPLLERMEKAGLVVRHRCPSDNRRVLVEPTELGRNIISRAPMGIMWRLRTELPSLDIADLEKIDSALDLLSQVALGNPPITGSGGDSKQ